MQCVRDGDIHGSEAGKSLFWKKSFSFSLEEKCRGFDQSTLPMREVTMTRLTARQLRNWFLLHIGLVSCSCCCYRHTNLFFLRFWCWLGAYTLSDLYKHLLNLLKRLYQWPPCCSFGHWRECIGMSTTSGTCKYTLRYESSTLILYKELSSPIFQSLWVSESGILGTCPDVNFVQYIKA